MKNLLKNTVKNLYGYDKRDWGRIILYEKCFEFIKSINPDQLDALEISGYHWKDLGFRSYTQAFYPDFDICKDCLPEKFDVIIADQVFEHLLWPYRAGKNVFEMLKENGYFIIATPFLVRIHSDPIDCSRWTETGLKYLLAECGFELEHIKTGSWGNRQCVKTTLRRWPSRGWGSLQNEPNFPIAVWAIAQKKTLHHKDID